jgi:hypothetical protein
MREKNYAKWFHVSTYMVKATDQLILNYLIRGGKSFSYAIFLGDLKRHKSIFNERKGIPILACRYRKQTH